MQAEIRRSPLWIAVCFGMLWRFWVVIWNSPDLAILADPLRHLQAARDLSLTNQFIFAVFDPPIYQYWLAFFIHFFDRFPFTLVLYSMVLTALTPLIWYLWMRLVLKDEKLALIGLTIFTFLPSYLTIFCFFMPETLLLPLLGLSLWLTNKAEVQPTRAYLISVAVLWGITVCTKANTAAACVVALIWLWWKLSKTIAGKPLLMTALLQLSIVGAIYSLTPLKVYYHMHSIILVPGTTIFNRVLYESGKAKLEVHGNRFDAQGKIVDYKFWCAHPDFIGQSIEIFRPLSAWKPARSGTLVMALDLDQLWPKFPHLEISLNDRLRYTYENILFFFFASVYPEEERAVFPYSLTIDSRWMWLPVTLIVLILASKRRMCTYPVVLAAVTAFVIMLQQSSIVEGRYRKPWEGLVLVALLDVSKRKGRPDSAQVKA